MDSLFLLVHLIGYIIIHYEFLNRLELRFGRLPAAINKLDIERYCWFDRDILQCIRSELQNSKELQKYETYFMKHKLRYGLDYPVNIVEAISAINNSGGISVLAHPMAYGLTFEQMQPIIKTLVSIGLQGIEVYQSDCSHEDSIKILNEANKYSLLYSVGSDFHRMINSDGREIGMGINNNLCITTTSVTEKLIQKKLVFKGEK